MRVRAYVDGFNLYYRALKRSPYKWLDLSALCRQFLEPEQTLDKVRYFTARVSPRGGDADAPRRQQSYLSALTGIPEVSTHYGNFMAQKKYRPLVSDPTTFVEIHDTEEKGSDVNLAAHLLSDGWQDHYDVALILSQDTDLCEPIRMVTQTIGKPVGLVVLDGRQPNKKLKTASSFVLHVTSARLAASQLSDPTKDRKGNDVPKPQDW